MKSAVSRRKAWTVWFCSFVVLLVLWDQYGRSVNPVLMVPPGKVVTAFVNLVESGTLTKALGESLVLLVSGYVSAAVVGIALGMLMGRYALMEHVLDPWVSTLYALPKSAITPLVMIWMGLSTSAQIFVVFLSGVIPNIVNTYTGVKHIDSTHLDVARSFGVSEREMFFKILLPAAMPSIISGLRLSAGSSAIGVVTAELFLKSSGVGGLVRVYQEGMRMDQLLAVVFVVMSFGYGLTQLAKVLEHHTTRWARAQHTD